MVRPFLPSEVVIVFFFWGRIPGFLADRVSEILPQIFLCPKPQFPGCTARGGRRQIFRRILSDSRRQIAKIIRCGFFEEHFWVLRSEIIFRYLAEAGILFFFEYFPGVKEFVH